ncbi:unnamed protein product [Musa hybrid cultivar]
MKQIEDLLSKFSGFKVEMRASLAKASALTLDCGWLKASVVMFATTTTTTTTKHWKKPTKWACCIASNLGCESAICP